MARRLGVGVREVKDAVAEVDPRKLLDAPKEQTRNGQHPPQQQPQQQPQEQPERPPAEPPAI
jgi:Sec-independent protein translocase protein TatA